MTAEEIFLRKALALTGIVPELYMPTADRLVNLGLAEMIVRESPSAGGLIAPPTYKLTDAGKRTVAKFMAHKKH
jgi:hypothetical protein